MMLCLELPFPKNVRPSQFEIMCPIEIIFLADDGINQSPVRVSKKRTSARVLTAGRQGV